MRGSINILAGAVFGLFIAGFSMAAPAQAAADKDCQKMGGEVSALIDANKTSPNIAAARAVFQTGIMECMEGDDLSANKEYQDAKNLLNNDQKPAPAAPAKASVATATVTPAADKDCQKVGGEVSALIDARPTSPNLPSARAVFQAGIMDCMEGDDVAANKHYLEAKNLLGGQ